MRSLSRKLKISSAEIGNFDQCVGNFGLRELQILTEHTRHACASNRYTQIISYILNAALTKCVIPPAAICSPTQKIRKAMIRLIITSLCEPI